MKQSKSTRTIALLMSMTMITSAFVGNTLSRYVTSVSSTDSARVAVWGINGAETTMNLFSEDYVVAGKTVAASNVDGEKIMAPGTAGEAPFSIINFEQDVLPEVAYEVRIELDDSQIADEIRNNPSVQWKLDDGAWGTLDQLKTNILSLAGNPSGKHVYEPGQFATAFSEEQEHTIGWQWVMDNNNNVMDTAMGNLALTNDLNAVIKVSITAEQVDDLVTNEYMIEGANQSVDINDIQPLTFRSASDISNFQRVEVNSQPLTEGTHYTATSGSTVVTLLESYLSTLTVDRYIINIVSSDMTASTVFEVVDELVLPEASDVLSENSWETISAITKAGKASDYWEVGEKTTVKVNGIDKEVAIAGINHDGNNTVTFVFTEDVTTASMNAASDEYGHGDNIGGWKESEMRLNTIPTILENMENKDLLKEVEKQTIVGYSTNSEAPTTLEVTSDKLFLLSSTEVFGGSFNEGTQYEYFKIADNRIVEPDEDGYGIWWWLRSPNDHNDRYFDFVYDDGNYLSDYADSEYSVVPAFVIG